jgi:hypothetical protein
LGVINFSSNLFLYLWAALRYAIMINYEREASLQSIIIFCGCNQNLTSRNDLKSDRLGKAPTLLYHMLSLWRGNWKRKCSFKYFLSFQFVPRQQKYCLSQNLRKLLGTATSQTNLIFILEMSSNDVPLIDHNNLVYVL